MTTFRIATAAFPVEEHPSMTAWLSALDSWVERAASQGAQLLVFPEYGAVSATSVFGRAIAADLIASTQQLQSILPEIDARLAVLARTHGLHILGPSAPRLDAGFNDGRWRNTAMFVAPSGGHVAQQKLIPTPWDRDPWRIVAGQGQCIIDTALGKIGIAICYDVEFPLLVRNLAAAGAEIILTPSCTDTLAGYWRVRTGCMARALENQCVVVQSPVVGLAQWNPALDVNIGAAGVFGPPDVGFPDTGVMALGDLDTPGWTCADIDLSRVAEARAAGATRNHLNWTDQPAAAADVVRLA